MINQAMLMLAVLAPSGIPAAPYDKKAKPKPSKIKPIANLTGPLGLWDDAHILEKTGAKITINKELSTENQEAGISATSDSNSRLSIHITIPQMIAKLNPKKKFDKRYFPNILRNNSYKT